MNNWAIAEKKAEGGGKFSKLKLVVLDKIYIKIM